MLVLPPPLAVRVVYMIPADAPPWLEMQARTTQVVEAIGQFISDEMKRHNYGERTLRIDRSSNGLVHFTERRSKYLKSRFEEASSTALHLIQCEVGPPELIYAELFVIEAYTIKDGVVSGDITGSSKRRACVSSLHLKAASREWIDSDDEFFGEVFPWISPEPTFNWKNREGKLGDVAGGCFGAIAHELIHCFGPENHKREVDTDIKSAENIMGTGRNMRAYLRGEDTVGKCVLSKHAAELVRDNLPDPE
jgi:hypothetical protein